MANARHLGFFFKFLTAMHFRDTLCIIMPNFVDRSYYCGDIILFRVFLVKCENSPDFVRVRDSWIKFCNFAQFCTFLYTVSQKGRHQTHGSNSVKPLPIFRILSLADSLDSRPALYSTIFWVRRCSHDSFSLSCRLFHSFCEHGNFLYQIFSHGSAATYAKVWWDL